MGSRPVGPKIPPLLAVHIKINANFDVTACDYAAFAISPIASHYATFFYYPTILALLAHIEKVATTIFET
jgi:hypothetical protein